MNTQRTVLGLVAIALAGILGWGLGLEGAQREGGEGAGSNATLQMRVASLEEEVALLRGELRARVDGIEASLRSDPGLAGNPNPPNSGFIGDPAGPPTQVAAAPPADRLEDADIARGLAEVLATEPLDDPWANPREREFYDFFAASPARDTVLLDARCQSTFCRVEVEHESGDAVETFVLEGILDAAFTSGELFFHHEMQPDGQIRTELFVARQGGRLPSIDRRVGN